MEQGLYVCDADVLINLWRHFREDTLKALRQMARHGYLRVPEGVCREILRGSDRLMRFVKRKRTSIEVQIQGSLRELVVEIDQKYGERIRFGSQEYHGFWKNKAGKRAADAQVVAVAKHLSAVCVSDDRAVRLACALENVRCIGWMEFARRFGLAKQPSLFNASEV